MKGAFSFEEAAIFARHAINPPDHIIYYETGGLLAAAIDPAKLEVLGAPVSVIENVYTLDPWPTAHFTVSDTGSIVYVPGFEMSSRLVWVDREGHEIPLTEKGGWAMPRVSPDVGQVAVWESRATWIMDVERKTRRRLQGAMPVWTPDGEKVACMKGDSRNLYWIEADGSGEEELLLTSESSKFPYSWSPDGRFLAFYQRTAATRADIWVLPLEEDRIPSPVITTEFNEHSPMFSPDGRWLAYVSDESGREEVYVQPYPGPGGKYPISLEGGRDPNWSPDGREIFYHNGYQLMAVAIETEPTFHAGMPRPLFELRSPLASNILPGYDVAPDGRRFLVAKAAREPEPIRFHVVLNWAEELKRLVPRE